MIISNNHASPPFLLPFVPRSPGGGGHLNHHDQHLGQHQANRDYDDHHLLHHQDDQDDHQPGARCHPQDRLGRASQSLLHLFSSPDTPLLKSDHLFRSLSIALLMSDYQLRSHRSSKFHAPPNILCFPGLHLWPAGLIWWSRHCTCGKEHLPPLCRTVAVLSYTTTF